MSDGVCKYIGQRVMNIQLIDVNKYSYEWVNKANVSKQKQERKYTFMLLYIRIRKQEEY